MRNLLIGKNVAYTAQATLDLVEDGALGVFYNDNGELKVSADGAAIKDMAMLVLGRPAANGGPVVLPIYKNNFSFVKGEYQAAAKFVGEITIPAPTKVGDYTIIVVKKGVGYNERSRYSASVYVNDVTMEATALAKALETQINNNSIASGVTASVSDAKITITAVETGVDYNIVPADELTGVAATITTVGKKAYGDVKYIMDLASKAAADAGFRDTYDDGARVIYPGYGVSPLAQPDAADTGFTIFTIKFTEPRKVGTRNDFVNQIVQIAIPTGSAQIATLETVLKAIAA